jgi:GNAT superfamily N-acetyltransferase
LNQTAPQIQLLNRTDREIHALDQLVSTAFGYRETHRFLQDFPIWKSDEVLRYGVFESQKLVSHVGLRVVEYQLNGRQKGSTENLKLGLIGAVATELHSRGRGLSTQLLQHLIQQSETSLQLDWLILWGSEHEFYQKLGFTLDGVQWRIPLDRLLIEPKKISGALSPQQGYTPKIFDWLLRQVRRSGIAWKESDRAWFEAHQTIDWHWSETPFAFAGLGRGMDLQHLVHEVGGDTTALSFLLRRIHQLDPQAELLTHPIETRTMPLSGLITPQTPVIEEKLCLSRPVSARARASGSVGTNFWISGLQAC